MGLIGDLGYQLPTPNRVQRAIWQVSSTRPGAWLLARILHHVDRLLLRLTRGRTTIAAIVAGIPVITLVTVGARSGRRREQPLIATPAGDDLAVIGTRFGQSGTPGWYHNLVAHPDAEVVYRGKVAAVRAREAAYDERETIWARARQIYAGYDSYARRIHDRPIHVMVLEASA